MATSTAQTSGLAKLGLPARLGVGAIGVVLVALVYWVVFYSDISAKIQAANNAHTRLQSELSKEQQAQASYIADRDELALRQQKQRELNKELPADTEAPAFLSALQQVANVSGVDLKSWQPLDEQQQAFYAKFPMKLEMSGRFHQIAKFAYEAGRVERIINIENIEMSDPHLDGDEVKVKAKCLATTFHAVAAKPAKAPGGKAPPGGRPPPGGMK